MGQANESHLHGVQAAMRPAGSPGAQQVEEPEGGGRGRASGQREGKDPALGLRLADNFIHSHRSTLSG